MKKVFWIWAMVGSILLFASSGTLQAAGEKQSISFEVPPQAQILSIDYYLKAMKEFGGGKRALHFDIKIKNSGDKPEKFSVMVSTPDGASAAGFIPAKAKKAGSPPVLEPKEEGKITLPLMTEEMAGSFSLTIEVAPQE